MQTVLLEYVTKLFRPTPSLVEFLKQERGTITRALHRISLSADGGEVLILLGPNGSGKTTLLKLIATMLLPDAGRIVVCGADTRKDSDRVRMHVGFAVASERSFFPRLSARENLEVFAALDDISRRERPAVIAAALEEVGLTAEADNLVMTFSSGMYQRLGLARAIIKRPSVLLLDEPTRSIDPGASVQVWQLLRRLARGGTTLILATHKFEEATALGDSVAFLREGELLASDRQPQGTAPEVLRGCYFREVERHAVTHSWSGAEP